MATVNDLLGVLKTVKDSTGHGIPLSVSQAIDTIGAAIGSWSADVSGLLPSPPSVPAPPSLSDLKDAIDKLNTLVTGFLSKGPQPLPVPDPENVLALIAKAVTSAETALNSQNLAIASGKLDITLNVGSDKGANANTNFTLDIRPTAFERKPE